VNPLGEALWRPAVLDPDTRLGHYDSKEDTLFLFYLFLLYQLNSKDLFPPELMLYVRNCRLPDPEIYRAPAAMSARPREPLRLQSTCG
jgi:hypothetical protein